ncbi:MAG: TIGR03619 family F420-dependent LLM class oxidoreductase, partial [Candidatus Binatia bacterium]
MSAGLGFGIALPNYGPLASAENLVRLARRAETRGVDSVWVSDHLVAPLAVGSVYPYDKRPDPKPGEMGVIEEFYEPLTTLAYLAGATQRIRLGVSVYVMPYRNPVVTAKMVATLDALSGGRLIFGVGVGWLREEFAALGQDARRRGRITDEYLEVCRRLWRDDVAEFAGEHYAMPAVRTGPKPPQRPWPPIWVGGNSRAARERAVELGDGLHLIDLTPDEAAAEVARVRADLANAGRDAASFTVSVRKGILVRATGGGDERPLYGTAAKIRRDARAYAAAGVGYLVTNLRQAKSIEELEKA